MNNQPDPSSDATPQTDFHASLTITGLYVMKSFAQRLERQLTASEADKAKLVAELEKAKAQFEKARQWNSLSDLQIKNLQSIESDQDECISWLEQQREVEIMQREKAETAQAEYLSERDTLRAELATGKAELARVTTELDSVHEAHHRASKWLVEERTRAESAEARCRVKDACLESMLNFVKNLHLNETQRQFVLEQIHKALGTDGKVLTTQNSIAKRALTELATERARADRVEANLVSTQDFRKADIQRINELGIENESLRAACAAMRAAINAKIDDMEPYEYCHKEARWVTVKQALRDYFRNLTVSTETRWTLQENLRQEALSRKRALADLAEKRELERLWQKHQKKACVPRQAG